MGKRRDQVPRVLPAGEESLLEPEDVTPDVGNGDAPVLEPGEHGAHPVDTGDVEGGAGEASPILGVGDLLRHPGLQLAEAGEPSGIDRTGTVTRWGMHEADPFTRHRVLVAPGDVEHPVLDRAHVRGQGHEPVIAVDDDERLLF